VTIAQPLLALAVLTLSLAGAVADDTLYPPTTQAPDVVLQTSFGGRSQNLIVMQIRRVLLGILQYDPLKRKLSAPIETDASLDGEGMGPLGRDLISSVLGFPMNQGVVHIKMSGISYDANETKVDVHPLRVTPDGMDVEAVITFSNVAVSADEIMISFRSDAERRTYFDRLYVKMTNPSMTSLNEKTLIVRTVFNFRTGAAGKLEIRSTDATFETFQNLTVEDLRDRLTFRPGTVQLPQVEVDVGRARLPLRNAGIYEAIERRKKSIMDLMLKPLTDTLQKLPAEVFQQQLDKLDLPTAFEIETHGITGKAKLHSFGFPRPNQFRAAFDLDFPDRPAARLAQTQDDARASFMNINELISRANTTTVVSLSEEAVNRVAAELVAKKLSALLPANIKLGPRGIFTDFHANQAQGAIVIDALVNVGFIPGLVLGDRNLRIPIVLYPQISFEPGESGPVFQFKIRGSDLTDATLLQGAYGIESDVAQVRLRGRVLRTIRKKLSELVDKVNVAVPITAFRDTDLSFASIVSDGHGRLNIVMNLDPRQSQDIAEFWNRLVALCQQALDKIQAY